jgi:hypothetical protein
METVEKQTRFPTVPTPLLLLTNQDEKQTARDGLFLYYIDRVLAEA